MLDSRIEIRKKSTDSYEITKAISQECSESFLPARVFTVSISKGLEALPRTRTEGFDMKRKTKIATFYILLEMISISLRWFENDIRT